jgi:hypothetical protein
MPAGVVAAHSRYQPRLFEHGSEYSTSSTDVNKSRQRCAGSGHKVSAAVNGSRKRCLSFCQADSPG